MMNLSLKRTARLSTIAVAVLAAKKKPTKGIAVRLLELTDYYSESRVEYVVIEKIVRFEPIKGGGTTVYLSDGIKTNVLESTREVAELLKNGKKTIKVKGEK
jgi:hypothetical protein